jgi:hypothetical protein
VRGCEDGVLVVGRGTIGDDGEMESSLTCEVDRKVLDFGVVRCDGSEWVLSRRPGMRVAVAKCPY